MACALAVAALIFTTRIERSSAPVGPVLLAPIAAAAGIGWLIGSTSAGRRQSTRSVALAIAAGAGGTLLGWLWHLAAGALGPLRDTGVATSIDLGFAMLPALAASAVVGRPGAATLGAATQLLFATSTGLPGASAYPAFAFLQLPLVVLPAELYSAGALRARQSERAHRTAIGGALVGLALGLGSAAATALLAPGMQVEATAEAALSAVVGLGAGGLIVMGMRRAGVFDRSPVPDLDPPPGGVVAPGAGRDTWDEPPIVRRRELR